MRQLCPAILILCSCFTANAQSFKLMRYDERYSNLQDSAGTFYNRIKFLPLSGDKKVYLSFGGEARYEYAAFNNEDWGKAQIGQNNFLLQRYDLHADLHIGANVRVFSQLRSALESGRKNGPRPIDEDELNVQNLFVDVAISKTLIVRAGRQEIDYGSGRLISVREGPNARLYFTGGKVMYSLSKLSVDGFMMMADTTNTGVFDNKSTRQVNLWGIYSKLIIPKSGNFDFYYLGLRRDASTFEEGTADEVRHTIGTRFWKYGGGFIYNFEAAWQFGKFGNGNIHAWTGSVDIGYVFKKVSINLRNDYISGDRKAGDGNLQTFNPLYPKGGYFGFDPQVGPVNLIDIHPYTTFALRKNVTLQLDVVFNWRYSLQDGIYRPSGSLNMAGASSNKRYTGTAYLASMVYSVSKFISMNTGIQYFNTGSFANDVIPGPKNGLFINTRVGFKF